MDVTLLGHASLLVEGGGVPVLMDPVFEDPFENDAVSCPRRVVHTERLGDIDAVILSHGHLDHFDLRSLNTLPHRLPVYLPEDPSLLAALRAAGFTRLRAATPLTPLRIGEMTVIPTESSVPHENGAIFKDTSGTLWNTVDTALRDDAVFRALGVLGGPPDVAICTYQPLLEFGDIWTDEDRFPWARYERLLEVAVMIRARTIIAGSAGQAIEGDTWLNHRIFPVSRERFAADLTTVAPDIRCAVIDPGDRVRVRRLGTGTSPRRSHSSASSRVPTASRTTHFTTPPRTCSTFSAEPRNSWGRAGRRAGRRVGRRAGRRGAKPRSVCPPSTRHD